MKATAIEDMMARPKFRPMVLKLNNGSKIPVKHPDFIMFTEAKSTVIVTVGEHFHVIDVDSITSIESPVR